MRSRMGTSTRFIASHQAIKGRFTFAAPGPSIHGREQTPESQTQN